MNTLAVNLLLAVLWSAFFGNFGLLVLGSGFVLAYLVMWLLQPLTGGPSPYFARVFYWIKLAILFLYELVVSSLQVLWDIVTPGYNARPAIIEVPLDVKSDAGILLVTNLISLTPGTLSLDVSEDRKTLSIHAMFADDPAAVCQTIKSGMEKWVIDAVEGRRA
ncbi:Na+/H+ antiporter subunit E [Salibaculum sp.]|jgi:multicomponent Na+:H+ antiporter subunit E|uniref:Na+/H+ antiporter subunit E n=1 Tax=Salibaculum sp. TaxID=2855480 RepID=UPI002B495D95|nr:Na+/H+ antiporter subunit E [Salibaculum sp.]HKL68665.1 Na+/H+ antiporter subunit E [Salibaculum sp.]